VNVTLFLLLDTFNDSNAKVITFGMYPLNAPEPEKFSIGSMLFTHDKTGLSLHF
jgi:hypothetical protein